MVERGGERRTDGGDIGGGGGLERRDPEWRRDRGIRMGWWEAERQEPREVAGACRRVRRRVATPGGQRPCEKPGRLEVADPRAGGGEPARHVGLTACERRVARPAGDDGDRRIERSERLVGQVFEPGLIAERTSIEQDDVGREQRVDVAPHTGLGERDVREGARPAHERRPTGHETAVACLLPPARHGKIVVACLAVVERQFRPRPRVAGDMRGGVRLDERD
jgi:hypothetical protein